MAQLVLPYPNITFVPLDVLSAEELNHIVANYTAISTAFPLGADNIASGAITNAKLASGAVTTAKIADGAVDKSKISFYYITASDVDPGEGATVRSDVMLMAVY